MTSLLRWALLGSIGLGMVVGAPILAAQTPASGFVEPNAAVGGAADEDDYILQRLAPSGAPATPNASASPTAATTAAPSMPSQQASANKTPAPSTPNAPGMGYEGEEEHSVQIKPLTKPVLDENATLFTYLDNFEFEERFHASHWNHMNVNMYNYDVTTLSDTFQVEVRNRLRGYEFVFPIKHREGYRITSGFGPRNMFGSKFHYGTDLEIKIGDTIVAAMEGRVRMVRNDQYGYGLYVMIAHENGLETLYAHMSKQLVKPGQWVTAGETIGLGGNTGRSTGPHLHFEFRFMGAPFDATRVCNFEHCELKAETIDIDRTWFQHLTEMKKAVYYTVKPGDNLGAIAQRHGTTITNICKLNGISRNTILKVGRKLRIR